MRLAFGKVDAATLARVRVCVLLVGCAAVAVASGRAMAAKPEAAAGQAAPQVLTFDFKATVQADGSVTGIEPDVALPEPIRLMIRKRVATWRFKSPRWKGNAGASTIQQSIHAVPVAVQGGVALRIEDVTPPVEVALREKDAPPPKYPAVLKRRGVGAVLVYAVLFDEAGKPLEVDLVYPSERTGDINHFDKAAREGMARWVWPKTFDGKPISCRASVPVIFGTVDTRNPPGSSRTNSSEADAFAKYTDMCPETTSLETSVKGTLL